MCYTRRRGRPKSFPSPHTSSERSISITGNWNQTWSCTDTYLLSNDSRLAGRTSKSATIAESVLRTYNSWVLWSFVYVPVSADYSLQAWTTWDGVRVLAGRDESTVHELIVVSVAQGGRIGGRCYIAPSLLYPSSRLSTNGNPAPTWMIRWCSLLQYYYPLGCPKQSMLLNMCKRVAW